MHYIKSSDIVDKFDINQNDILWIASDIKRFLYVALKNHERVDLNKFIDSFLSKIGPGGTLVFPTFNWGFCRRELFDFKNTPSQTGILSSTALARKDFSRTLHPIYSFAVSGRFKEQLISLRNQSSFGEDSPFAFMSENHAKMLIIDLPYQNSFTFVHYVEEREQVVYRYLKYFTADYLDENGVKDKRTYSMYVRDIDRGVLTNIEPIGKVLEDRGVSQKKVINGIVFKLIHLHKALSIITDDIRNNQAKNLHIIKE